jgi:hypothetical protein
VTVNSHNNEFGYELISVIPYAYWLHEKGMLQKTISGFDTEPLYYFSPNHEINPEPRSWHNINKLDTPNKHIHRRTLDTRQFMPPPYKKIYSGHYDFDIVVCNRYYNEWTAVPELNKPINYFDLDFLSELFTRNSNKNIAYLNVHGFKNHYDHAGCLDLGDYEFCSQFGNVTHIKDLVEDSLNETQLKVMASANKFYTLNGGYAILASYFGGTNYIYTNPVTINGRVRPREVETGDFEYYHLFGGSEIIHRNLKT